MNTFHYMSETTKDKIRIASILEHQLRMLLNEIELDTKTENQIEKLYELQIQLMKRWAPPISNRIEYRKPSTAKQLRVNVLELEEVKNWLVNKLDKRKDSYLSQEIVDIGFGNTYMLHTIKSSKESFPFDTLVFDKQTNQVIIKLGDNTKNKIVNAKLSNVYKQTEDNARSIICNNNIRSKKLYCHNTACKYYHDPYIGYVDNMHSSRQFANCPIVFNCPDFKSGACVKKNTKCVDWIDSITLYQSSLCNILIACVHADSS